MEFSRALLSSLKVVLSFSLQRLNLSPTATGSRDAGVQRSPNGRLNGHRLSLLVSICSNHNGAEERSRIGRFRGVFSSPGCTGSKIEVRTPRLRRKAWNTGKSQNTGLAADGQDGCPGWTARHIGPNMDETCIKWSSGTQAGEREDRTINYCSLVLFLPSPRSFLSDSIDPKAWCLPHTRRCPLASDVRVSPR